MRRILPERAFRAWFAAFLPDLADGQPGQPVHAGLRLRPLGRQDRPSRRRQSQPRLVLARPRRRARSGARRARPRDAADAHLDASLPHVAGDYMGEHWLATFALLALEAA